MLLPCAKDVCQECAVDHEPCEPHDAQSLYYQYKFYEQHGRWPTWKDAIAHCATLTKVQWELVLRKRGLWPGCEAGCEAGTVDASGEAPIGRANRRSGLATMEGAQ